MPSFSRILIPLDFTQCSVAVLPHAELMAETFKADLYLLYTLPGPEQLKGLSIEQDWFTTYDNVLRTEAERAMKNFTQQHMQGWEPTATAIKTGDTVEEIVCFADEMEIDLIIMASHSCQTAERRIYGSVAEAVSRDAGCPVMIIHPEN